MKWTYWRSSLLSKFLHQYPDLPIVAHSAKGLMLDVLGPAFERVGNGKMLPKTDRWRCTQELSSRKAGAELVNLDDTLTSIGLGTRSYREHHDAESDATLIAKAYMILSGSPASAHVDEQFHEK